MQILSELLCQPRHKSGERIAQRAWDLSWVLKDEAALAQEAAATAQAQDRGSENTATGGQGALQLLKRAGQGSHSQCGRRDSSTAQPYRLQEAEGPENEPGVHREAPAPLC